MHKTQSGWQHRDPLSANRQKHQRLTDEVQGKDRINVSKCKTNCCRRNPWACLGDFLIVVWVSAALTRAPVLANQQQTCTFRPNWTPLLPRDPIWRPALNECPQQHSWSKVLRTHNKVLVDRKQPGQNHQYGCELRREPAVEISCRKFKRSQANRNARWGNWYRQCA